MDASPRTSATRNREILNQRRVTSVDIAATTIALEREWGLRFVARTLETATPEQVAAAISQTHGLDLIVEPVFTQVDPEADAI